jgi:serine/threonine protein kinase
MKLPIAVAPFQPMLPMDQPSPGAKSVFDQALEIDTLAERQAYLDAACAGQQISDAPHSSFIPHPPSFRAGRPYFVMELVQGLPLTQFCDERGLSLRQRLELFIPVCQAVQHAHQKGIIHRDLKPTNVLVALYDGKPVPKVIDFGVAKALHQPLTERTMVTELGMLVGTPEYMAPEQAEVNALDVDTRADTYWLGVILYELLTGTTPFDRRQMSRGALVELLRLIREVEPLTPSKKLASADTVADTATHRRTISLGRGRKWPAHE